MILVECAATAIAVAYFACMGWAVRGHFLGDGPMPAGMRVATVANAVAFAWYLWGRWEVLARTETAPLWRAAVGVVVTIGAMSLFWWAIASTRRARLSLAFSKDEPSFLVASGPYAVIRHPFYASYVLFWIAAAFESPSLAFWGVPAVIACLYARAATLEERKFEASPLAPRYREYKARTGMMLPRPPRWAGEVNR